MKLKKVLIISPIAITLIIFILLICNNININHAIETSTNLNMYDKSVNSSNSLNVNGQVVELETEVEDSNTDNNPKVVITQETKSLVINEPIVKTDIKEDNMDLDIAISNSDCENINNENLDNNENKNINNFPSITNEENINLNDNENNTENNKKVDTFVRFEKNKEVIAKLESKLFVILPINWFISSSKIIVSAETFDENTGYFIYEEFDKTKYANLNSGDITIYAVDEIWNNGVEEYVLRTRCYIKY